MPKGRNLSSEIVLIGTGLAPLLVAYRMLSLGRSVSIVNPDYEFFRENSELSIDPIGMLPDSYPRDKASWQKLLPDAVVEILRPEFPGSVESLNLEESVQGYYDPLAPHVRTRSRIWLDDSEDRISQIYLEAGDAKLNPLLREGWQAIREWPGHSGKTISERKSVVIPKTADVDVGRYRTGLLEFIRHRLAARDNGGGLFLGASQIEFNDQGIQFHAGDHLEKIEVTEKVLVFWTPLLTTWVEKLLGSKIKEATPRGVRLWENWVIRSRDEINPKSVGVFKNLMVWCDFQGAYEVESREGNIYRRLAILRKGPLVPLDQWKGASQVSQKSFSEVSELFMDILKWDKFSIRFIEPFSTFEYESTTAPKNILTTKGRINVEVITAVDGPIADVVARSSLV